jgi:hypothetical protein
VLVEVVVNAVLITAYSVNVVVGRVMVVYALTVEVLVVVMYVMTSVAVGLAGERTTVEVAMVN